MSDLSWHWVDGNKICNHCDWLILAEKFYYVCIGCERTQDKEDFTKIIFRSEKS